MGAGFVGDGHDQVVQQERGDEAWGGGDLGGEVVPKLENGKQEGEVVYDGGGAEHVSVEVWDMSVKDRWASGSGFEYEILGKGFWGEREREREREAYRVPNILAAFSSRERSEWLEILKVLEICGLISVIG